MNRYLTPLLLAASLMTGLQGSATEYDSEGYPILYLKGADYANWSTDASLKMSREGNVYTYALPKLTGEFKISDDDWKINFGSETQNAEISAGMTVNGVRNGFNFKANGQIEDVTITLRYDLNNVSTATISFTTGGDIPPVTVVGLSGTLPVLYINVYDEAGNFDNEIIDKDLAHKNYFSGEYWLDLNGCEWMEAEGAKSIGSAEEPLPLEIKARGNWTRIGFSKKPFKLKLGKKQSLLGLSKSKHFAILAHADDNVGYLRNFTGFNLGNRIGLPWTPSQQPVEVVINNDYRGLYFLTESIRIEEDRVNITELNDGETNLELLSGGYLIELDNYDEPDESQLRMPEKGDYPGYKDELRITFDTPEVYSDYQRMFINQQFSKMNDLVGLASDELWSYIDLDDAARYYLVCELMCHVEAFHGSTYMFRDFGENQKWHFSPLWDFGNGFNGPTDGYIYDYAPYGMTWVGSWTYNQKFNDKVRETWKWFLSNNFNGIYSDMEQICARLGEAAVADHRRWKDKPVPYGGTSVADNSNLQDRLDAAKEHLRRKVEWLKTQFGEFSNGTYAEPARDNTPAAPLPEFLTVGTESVSSLLNDAEAVYYNLQGQRINHPGKGEILIKVAGDDSRKVIIR